MTTPKKDIIYVDIEDDITSVINKVKHAQAPIVALVPPKRTGMLQSIVNLKLLHRVASNANKRLVIITNDSALAALAAGVSIPVAKNLQTKPELAEISALQIDDEEVIDGDSLPVGAHAGDVASSAMLDEKSTTDDVTETAAAPIAAEKALRSASKKKDTGAKVPNFSAFKKKAFLIGGGVAALVIFLVWAIWFAPNADVTITAKTTPYNVATNVSAKRGADIDVDSGLLPAQVESIKETNSLEFTATGKKDVGKKATGTVEFSTRDIERLGTTIPSGTVLASDSGAKYKTDESVTMTLSNFRGAEVSITAEKRGEKFNGASGSVTGAPSGIRAEIQDSTSGGTDKTLTVVSDADVAKAKEELESKASDDVEADLAEKFEGEDVTVLSESFEAESSNPSISPSVGSEASRGTISVEMTYSLAAIENDDVQALISENVTEQLEGLPEQKIYKFGVEDARFENVKKSDSTYTFSLTTTAYAGPVLDIKKLTPQLAGKVEGEIQELIKARDGVDSVDVRFSPFWVSKVNSEDDITIKFDIENAE